MSNAWTVQDTHPFFPEVRATFAFMIGSFGVHTYQALYEQFGRVVGRLTNHINQHVCTKVGDRDRLTASITAPNFPNTSTILAEGCDEALRLQNCLEYVEYLLDERPRPDQFSFELITKDQADRDAEEEASQPSVTETSFSEYMPRSDELLWGYAIGARFEEYRSRLASRYGGFRNYPALFQLFRHLRNGCFHRNQFNITPDRSGRPQIDPANPPSWRSLVMTDDATLNGTTVIGGFLKPPHILPLMADLGDALVAEFGG